MNDLIEKLEAATEGSRELDTAIALSLPYFCDPTCCYDTADDCLSWYEYFGEPGAPGALCKQELPYYTTSIDDALTLVPDDVGWNVEMMHGNSSPMKSLDPSGQYRCTVGWNSVVTGWSVEPSLAICIAALKAHLDGAPRKG